MSRDFGLYPQEITPKMWIGARAIITGGVLDIPWDRWSSEFVDTDGKGVLFWWIDNEALPRIEREIKKHNTKGSFESIDGMFKCEWDDKQSGGYCYIGFYSLK